MIRIDQESDVVEVCGSARQVLEEFVILSSVMVRNIPKIARKRYVELMRNAVDVAEIVADEHDEQKTEVEKVEGLSKFLQAALKTITEEDEE